MPLPLIVPIILLGGAAIAVAASKKTPAKPTVPPPPAGAAGQLTWEQTVNKAYQDCMASTDLVFIGESVNWMNTYGNRPDLYAAMRTHYDDVYRAKAQKVAYDQATGGSPSSDDLTKVYNTAMSSDMKDPAQLQWASALLRGNGRSAQANDVDAKRNSILLTTGQAKATPGTGGIVATVPPAPPPVVVTTGPGVSMPPDFTIPKGETPLPPTAPTTPSVPALPPAGGSVTVPTPAGNMTVQLPPGISVTLPGAALPTPTPTPIQTHETTPQADPNGTVSLARQMIGVESQSGWKTALKAEIQAWQARMRLVVDGKFGPNSALLMADEIGVLPLIRYWSSTGGTKEQQLSSYRTKLLAKANTFKQTAATKPHGVALELSAIHEQGQGYPTSPGPLPPTDAADFARKLDAALQTITTGA